MTTKLVFIQSQGVDGVSYDVGDVVTFDNDAQAHALVACGVARLSFDAATRDHAADVLGTAGTELKRKADAWDVQQAQLAAAGASVTMRQAQLALLAVKFPDGSSLLDRVDAAIASMAGDEGRAAQITWTKSADVQRSNPLITQLQGALALSDAQIDALFEAAAKL